MVNPITAPPVLRVIIQRRFKLFWQKFSEPLKKLGEWFLNIGLASYVALIIPLFKSGNKFNISIKGILVVVLTVILGLVLILVSEFLKKEESK